MDHPIAHLILQWYGQQLVMCMIQAIKELSSAWPKHAQMQTLLQTDRGRRRTRLNTVSPSSPLYQRKAFAPPKAPALTYQYPVWYVFEFGDHRVVVEEGE